MVVGKEEERIELRPTWPRAPTDAISGTKFDVNWNSDKAIYEIEKIWILLNKGNRRSTQAHFCSTARDLKTPFSNFSSSSGVPISTISPFDKTMIRSKFLMVRILWATAMIVQSLKCFDMTSCIALSVSSSIEELDSSRTTIFRFLNKARAREKICFWPGVKTTSFPVRRVSSFSGRALTKSESCESQKHSWDQWSRHRKRDVERLVRSVEKSKSWTPLGWTVWI